MNISPLQPFDSLSITTSLAAKLIAEQFPAWADLPVRPVEFSGWDNRTFRLGETMLIRLPSAEHYAPQVHKEHQWLPYLAPCLPLPISTPLALGHPSHDYPWHWSVYQWIEGESAANLSLDTLDLPLIASQLAHFLRKLHALPSTGGPTAGPHNFWRGGPLEIYDAETRSALATLDGFIDTTAALSVWEEALNSEWHTDPVWIHGDFSSGNFLVKNGTVAAIIDFGCMGIGDPACDLVLRWTFFQKEARQTFIRQVDLDKSTWSRARGWALWKALITLVRLKGQNSPEISAHQHLINDIIS
ncbi:aminoglycoside phosphotransferase family protein [Candidatus Dependentiae bacterium]|nr:aminoglycoside phosphotransferase family protein [Candidatus Dependentiae bacterium]